MFFDDAGWVRVGWVLVLILSGFALFVGMIVSVADDDEWTKIDNYCYVHNTQDNRFLDYHHSDSRAVYCLSTR